MGVIGDFIGGAVGKLIPWAKSIIGKIKGAKDFIGKLPVIGPIFNRVINSNATANAISRGIDMADKVASTVSPYADNIADGIKKIIPFSQRPNMQMNKITSWKIYFVISIIVNYKELKI